MSDPLLAGREKGDGKDRPDAELAGDVETAAVAVDDMLDDGEAESGAAQGARARRVDAIETLGQPGQVLAPDAFAVVAHRDGDRRRRAAALGEPGDDVDRRALAAVFDGVVDEVLEDLR